MNAYNKSGLILCPRLWGRFLLLFFLAISHLSASPDNVPEWSLATRLYGDEKARSIGDLITVIIEEKSSANKTAQSQSGKSTSGGGSASIAHPVYTRGETGEQQVNGPWTRASLPAFDWKLSHDFSGGGQVQSEEGLASILTARVQDVLPNGTLLIEGRRLMQLQDERVEMILTGMVRPRDIASDNSVSSERIADAAIRYDTSGPLTRDQKRGLFTRLVNWINIF